VLPIFAVSDFCPAEYFIAESQLITRIDRYAANFFRGYLLINTMGEALSVCVSDGTEQQTTGELKPLTVEKVL
jgi:hypothetical protein